MSSLFSDHDLQLDLRLMEWKFPYHMRSTCNKAWSNNGPSRIAVIALDFGKDRELEYSRHKKLLVLHPSSPSGWMWNWFPSSTRYWKVGRNAASRLQQHFGTKRFAHNCVNCILSGISSKLKTLSYILYPVARVGGEAKRCLLLVATGSKSWCPQVTVLLRLNQTENDSTTHGTDASEYTMTSIFESLHHFGGCRIPLPYLSTTRTSTPLCFQPWTQERPMSWRESHLENPAFSEFESTSHRSSFHWMSLNIENDQILELLWLDLPSLQVLLDYLKNS